MGKDRLIYLSGAIQGGEADNATLGWWWQSATLPYKHNEGQPARRWQREVCLPAGLVALTNLDIELDFINTVYG